MRKRFTTTKMLLLLNYIIVFVILIKMFLLIDEGADFSNIATLGTVLGVFGGICGYTVKWYYWKAKAENVFKIHLGLIDDMLRKQKRNPSYKVFDEYNLKEECNTLVNALKSEENRTIYESVSEDVTTQIY